MLKILGFGWSFLMGALIFCAQIGPDEAVSNLSKRVQKAGIETTPSWLLSKATDTWAIRIGVLGLLAMVGVAGVKWGIPWVLTHWRLESGFVRTIKPLRAVSIENELISMRDAATRFFSEARICKAPVSEDIEVLRDQGTDAMLEYAALILACKIPMWGKRPPSTAFERVSMDDYKAGLLHFRGGGNELRKIFGGAIAFHEMQVATTDLDRVIAEMRSRKAQ
jgi:hypothetical protein